MATLEGDVEALSRAILAEAEAETHEIEEKAQTQADAIRRRAEAEAENLRASILDRASQEAGRLKGQALATAQLKARSLELQRREQVLEKVFAEAAVSFSRTPSRQDYPEIISQLVRDGLGQLRIPKAVVRADKSTGNLLTSDFLGRISKDLGVELAVGEPLEVGTGVVLQSVDGRLTFDNTLETRLERLSPGLRASVYRILMGESA
jgi:vacuolar-type H+-ATPase subunit E/Vma4